MRCRCGATASRLALCAIAWGALACPAVAGQGKKVLPGPVEFRVGKVHDGDSFSGEALVWPGHRVQVNVRVRGIDAPELNSKCGEERRLAQDARQHLAQRLAGAGVVRLMNIGGDKYNGRVIADVVLEGGGDLARQMLDDAPVRPYSGGKRTPWCS